MTPAEYRANYAVRYDHTRWADHRDRVAHTLSIAREVVERNHYRRAGDLSAGDRAIVTGLGLTDCVASDWTDGTDIMDMITRIEPVDIYICTETIEHLEAPWTLLERIAEKTKCLILSTPMDEGQAVGNWEHYWSFTVEDVFTLLHQSGFPRMTVDIIHPNGGGPYIHQIWTAYTS